MQTREIRIAESRLNRPKFANDTFVKLRTHCSRPFMRICHAMFGRGDHFVRKLNGNSSGNGPLQCIRNTRNRPNPKVFFTVDIPVLEFIVLLCPLKSRILWAQMRGRGTLMEHFNYTTAFEIQPPTIPQVIENSGRTWTVITTSAFWPNELLRTVNNLQTSHTCCVF